MTETKGLVVLAVNLTVPSGAQRRRVEDLSLVLRESKTP
eukprot:CAMPEP_0184749830 /NCGR_PEP_ID=MMETSP0315-20130426/31258_1 /TAXON_ID=101924 /ORGANISM="Rhodosorus marinus, Strain UTEX LB 2760" /LENGTH=38 /DNA_ID= /DNA_START= /DNA_END= /DNA_ORIENTATION=